jgi:hypothetical protein
MKILKALAILPGGPTLGLLAAFFLGAMALRPDPNFAANGGHAAPGDGILILLFIFISLVISVPTSLFFAVRIFLRNARPENLSGSRVS